MPRHDMNLSALAGLLKKEKYLLAQISADYWYRYRFCLHYSNTGYGVSSPGIQN